MRHDADQKEVAAAHHASLECLDGQIEARLTNATDDLLSESSPLRSTSGSSSSLTAGAATGVSGADQAPRSRWRFGVPW
ncbi:hypothetical protein GCM10009654_56710 [Streptomyces hebeiensis]|uniref:Uncharacterized protein n=1 Tax=Streptomyces hebeiensis TaxID=229486 RepID=A0ABP4FMT1_9ACTN